MPERFTPWILVSHSARTGRGRLLRNAIYSDLKQQTVDHHPRYRVLLDEADFEPADAWRSINDGWLSQADGVVLLLNQAALREESYVLYEVIVMWLRWREAKDRFGFVIVRFPDVDDALLERRLKPLPLQEIQHIQLTDLFLEEGEQTDTGEVQAEIATVVAAVVKSMERLPVARSMHPIEKELVNTLSHQAGDSADFRQLFDLLYLAQDIAGKPKEEASRIIVERLLNPKKPVGAERLIDMRKTVEYLMSVFKSEWQLRRFINRLTPHCWVNADAAARLCRIVHHPEGSKIVAWTRNWDYSEKMYLCRAWGKILSRVIHVESKSGDVEDWKARVRVALAGAFYEQPTATTKAIRLQMKECWENNGEPVWIVLSASLAGQSIMESLSLEWPEVGFFVFQLENENALSDHEWTGLERISPALDPDLERTARREWGDLMIKLGVPPEQIVKGEVFA
ncbi:MAG TPA: hypothetical protein VGO11_09990 [Chthoniobacteraceae bacterium]|jgi:hypothetical protein|nr:hypothetical protein [Chthoniobacteraceae bacterium]